MMETVILGNIMIDTDNIEVLQNFYSELFAWEKCTAFGDPGVRTGNGVLILFNHQPLFVKPVWPVEAGKQQRQMHLDVQVSDVDYYVAKALKCGAELAQKQTGGKVFVTILDPSGHPICLCAASNSI